MEILQGGYAVSAEQVVEEVVVFIGGEDAAEGRGSGGIAKREDELEVAALGDGGGHVENVSHEDDRVALEALVVDDFLGDELIDHEEGHGNDVVGGLGGDLIEGVLEHASRVRNWR